MVEALNCVRDDDWVMYNGDCIEVMAGLPTESVGFSVFSPPFSSLYTYSNSDRDLGNCRTDDEFFRHFDFVLHELHRVLKPGRLVSIHCMDMPRSKTRNGVIGAWDFPGAIIRAAEQIGFVFHSRVCIWKNPVTAMQRTKALGLLHKQVKKDSSMSRQGFADYVVTLRKRDPNAEAIDGPFVEYYGEGSENIDAMVAKTLANPDARMDPTDARSVAIWQKYASPVWMDINPSDTLQYRAGRDDADERHIAPLQLDVIRRCIDLWSNPGDVVLSPFAGIASEIYAAVEMGRKAIGIELKPSYFEQGVRNMLSLTPPSDSDNPTQ